jgi:hypothetical protein
MKNKNKLVLSIFVLLLAFFFPKNASALTASMSCSSSGSVTLNNTITVTISGSASGSSYWQGTLSYDTSKLSLTSGNVTPFTDSATSRPSFTYTFKAIATGSAYVKMANMSVSDETGSSEISISSSSCNINVVSASSSSSSSSTSKTDTTKSSDNNLKSLTVDDYEISPEFNKDTLEYSLEVPSGTEKIKINASANDSKSKVSGTGEIEVNEGLNQLNVIVTAENGSTKTYVINVNVLEKDPIVVKVNKEKLSVVRKRDNLEAPEGYEETTVSINGEEIPAYKSDITGYVLVGLTDADGKVSLYIFDQDKLTYTKYNEIKSNSIRIILLKANKKDIPYKYYKNEFDLNGEMVDGYTFDSESDFRLVYGMNIETGEKSFYVYDIKEKTLQRFYNDQTLIYIELVKKCKFAFLLAGVALGLLFLIIIILLFKNIRFKKKFLSKVSEPHKKKKEEIEYKNIEATQAIDTVNIDDLGKKKKK